MHRAEIFDEVTRKSAVIWGEEGEGNTLFFATVRKNEREREKRRKTGGYEKLEGNVEKEHTVRFCQFCECNLQCSWERHS